VHMQVTPFTEPSLCLPVYVSPSPIDGRDTNAPRLLSFISPRRESKHQSSSLTLQMHLEQNREIVENQRDQGLKLGGGWLW
jgi:hypothetical protein